MRFRIFLYCSILKEQEVYKIYMLHFSCIVFPLCFRGSHQAASYYGGGRAQGQSDSVQMAHPGSFLPVVLCRQNCNPLDLQWVEHTPWQSVQRPKTTELCKLQLGRT